MSAKTLGFITFLLVVMYLFFRYVIGYVMPFVVGVFLAFLLEPLVSWLSRKIGLKRSVSAFITIVTVLGSTFVIIWFGVERILLEVSDLYGDFPQYYQEFQRIFADVLRIAGEFSQSLPEPLARMVQDQWNRIYSILSVLATGAGGVVRGVPGFSVTVIFSVLSTYFIMRDRAAIGDFFRRIIPPRVFRSFKNVELDMLTGVVGFIRAQVVLVIASMLINILALSLLKCRYSVAVGVLLAILDVLPIVGPGLIYLPWVAYHLIWGKASFAIGLIVLYLGNSFFRQIAQTHLVGREMGLHPLVTLMSLYVGFRMFSAMGLIYGPLTAILIKGLWASGIIPREDKEKHD